MHSTIKQLNVKKSLLYGRKLTFRKLCVIIILKGGKE